MTGIQSRLLRRIVRSGDALEYPLPNASLAPSREAVVDGLVRTIVLRAILPAAADLQNVHDAAENAALVLPLGSGLVRRQMRNDLCPLFVIEPKQARVHRLDPQSSTKPLNQINLVWVWTLV